MMAPVKTLSLYSNLLTQLPEEIILLKHLCSLDVAYNKLQDFPSVEANSGALPHLKIVHLEHNEIESFPEVSAFLWFAYCWRVASFIMIQYFLHVLVASLTITLFIAYLHCATGTVASFNHSETLY